MSSQIAVELALLESAPFLLDTVASFHALSLSLCLFAFQPKDVATNKAGAALINNRKDSTEEVGELLMDSTSAASQCPGEKPQDGQTDSNELQNQANNMKKSTNSAALDGHLVGDVNLGWKMVLHEESNQYYYWNVTTGETSWEMPNVLAQQTVDTSAEKDISDTAEKTDAIMGTYQSSTALGKVEDDFQASVHPKGDSEAADSVDPWKNKDGPNDGSITDVMKVEEDNREANQDHCTSLLGGHSIESNSSTDLSVQLIKQCESLLERLSSMKGYATYLRI